MPRVTIEVSEFMAHYLCVIARIRGESEDILAYKALGVGLDTLYEAFTQEQEAAKVAIQTEARDRFNAWAATVNHWGEPVRSGN